MESSDLIYDTVCAEEVNLCFASMKGRVFIPVAALIRI